MSDHRLVTPIDPRIASGQVFTAMDAPPLYPPDEWFSDETMDAAPPKLTVLASGQVFGVVAPTGRCILDGVPGCWSIPRPADGRGSAFDCPNDADYRLAHVGTTVLASGAEIPTAMLAGAGGHHSYFSTVQDPAKSEYADIGRAVARGRYGYSDVAGGLVFAGALVPTLDEVKIAAVRCSAVSVDYRYVQDEGRQILLGSTLVNIGGLPSRYSRPIIAGASVLVDPRLIPQETPMEPHACSCNTKLATYTLIPLDPAEPPSMARITWGMGMVGAFDGSLAMADGSVVWMIRPELDGELADYDERVGVPASQCTVTGERYDWESDMPDENAVRAAAADVPGMISDPEVVGALSNIDGKLDEMLAKINDLHSAMLDNASMGVTEGL